MRKIIESTLVSADGVVGSPPLWAMEYRDEEVTRDALERLSGCDAMLIGRGSYELFAAIWPTQTDDFAQRVNEIRKYVFSSTLDRADWSNSTIVRGDVLTEVAKIKERDGRDIAVFGHGQLAQTLLEHGLTKSGSRITRSSRCGTGAVPQWQQDAADAGLGQAIQDRRRDPLLPGQRSRT